MSPPFRRLSARFDVVPLQADLAALADAPWTPHFNDGDHDGRWSGLPLRAPRDGDPLVPAALPPEAFGPTAWLARAPALAAVLATLPWPMRSARLLRLDPGGFVREHCDPGLGLDDGEARLHVPITTHARAFFYVDGRRAPMREGELWYADVSRRHRVHNLGDTPRVHLVVDALATPALHAALAAGDDGDPWPPGDDPVAAFDRFRDLVAADAALADALLAEDDPWRLADRAVALAAARGLSFTVEEVHAARRAGRRAWSEVRRPPC